LLQWLITHPAGKHHTWTTDRALNGYGQGTPIYPWDDEFSTGSASGVTTANEIHYNN
jgi:hypothetical protein